jgi:hypothetical protein
METEGLFEVLVSTYTTAWLRGPEDNNPDLLLGGSILNISLYIRHSI